MSLSISDFWNLVAKSRLIAPERCRRYRAQFQKLKGADSAASARTLAQWLVSEKAMTGWQASVLLLGKAGPFVFGPYRLETQIRSGELAGCFRARHVPSGQRVFLCFLSESRLAESDLPPDELPRNELSEEDLPETIGASVDREAEHSADLAAAGSVRRRAGGSTSGLCGWSACVMETLRAAEIKSDYLVRCFEPVDLGRYKFIVFEQLQGESLRAKIEQKSLSTQAWRQIVSQAARGLAVMHGAGLAHGAVRPENILIDAAGGAKLLTAPLVGRLPRDSSEHEAAEVAMAERAAGTDSGAAAGAGPDKAASQQDMFLAPELKRRSRTDDRATPQGDVYALGITLRELLRGWPNNEVPSALRHLVQTTTAADPSLRFDSAQAVVAALAPLLSGGKSSAEKPAEKAPTADASETQSAHQAFERDVEQRLATWLRTANQRVESSSPAGETAKSDSPAARTTADKAKSPTSHEPFPSIQVDVSHASSRARKGRGPAGSGDRKKAGKALWISLAAAMALVGAAAAIHSLLGRDDRSQVSAMRETGAASATTDRAKSDRENTAGTSQTPGPKDAAESQDATNARGGPNGVLPATPREMAVPDDGKTLWVSPTAGPPIRLNYMPPGAQMFLCLRLSELARHSEYDKLRVAIGPLADQLVETLQKNTGFKLDEMEQLIVGVRALERGSLSAAYVVRLIEPTDASRIASRFGGASPTEHNAQTFYRANGRAVYLPPDEADRLLVIADEQDILESIDLAGAEPPLRRETEQILSATDETRLFTLIAAPNFLFVDGAALWNGPAGKLRDPLEQMIPENLRAISLSMHLDDRFFIEVRAVATAETRPTELADTLRKDVSALPERVEHYLVTINPHPYGRLVLFRLPQMVRLLGQYTRSDATDSQAVLRSYLPPEAAHNLLMALELAVAENPGAARAGADVGEASGPAPPATVADRLARRTTLKFNRDTLETAVKTLADDIGVEIRLAGADLQLDGITKNQSFGIDLQDQPAERILTQILLLANSDKTASGPADNKQKLVYVIKPLEPGGQEGILVTTRAQAAKRGDTLPKQFVDEEKTGEKSGDR